MTCLICGTSEFQISRNQFCVFLVYLHCLVLKANKLTLIKTKGKLSYLKLS